MLVSPLTLATTNDEYWTAPTITDDPTGPIKVVTSLSVIADWAVQIGKNVFTPSAVVTGGEDPHTFELLASDIQMILDSDLFIIFGLPGLESWIDLDSSDYDSLNVLQLANEDMMITDPLTEDENPHVWMSPFIVQTFVQNITDEVVFLDFDNQAQYESNRMWILRHAET